MCRNEARRDAELFFHNIHIDGLVTPCFQAEAKVSALSYRCYFQPALNPVIKPHRSSGSGGSREHGKQTECAPTTSCDLHHFIEPADHTLTWWGRKLSEMKDFLKDDDEITQRCSASQG